MLIGCRLVVSHTKLCPPGSGCEMSASPACGHSRWTVNGGLNRRTSTEAIRSFAFPLEWC